MNPVRSLLVLLTLFCVVPSAIAGTSVGNGGNPIEQEFTALAGDLLALLRYEVKSLFPEVDATAFEAAVKSTRIEVTQALILSGKDAMNYPDDKKILVKESGWKALKGQKEKKLAFVFHEYLGILGVEINSYGISNRMLAVVSGPKAGSLEVMNPGHSRAYDLGEDAKVRFSCIRGPQSEGSVAPHVLAEEDANTRWVILKPGETQLTTLKRNERTRVLCQAEVAAPAKTNPLHNSSAYDSSEGRAECFPAKNYAMMGCKESNQYMVIIGGTPDGFCYADYVTAWRKIVAYRAEGICK